MASSGILSICHGIRDALAGGPHVTRRLEMLGEAAVLPGPRQAPSTAARHRCSALHGSSGTPDPAFFLGS